MNLVLFDIDGTLLRSGGAGREAMDLAFQDLFGVADAFRAVDFRGALDDQVFEQVCHWHGVGLGARSRARFKRTFAARLAETLDPKRNTRLRLCPGVEAALEALARRSTLALVTGNWEVGARGKLGVFQLWDRFAFGAFSEDGRSRAELIGVALHRARARGLATERAVMIGDTPADVAAAREAGVLGVAVRTGWSEPEALVASAPDLLLPDLERGLPDLLDLCYPGSGGKSA